MGWLRPRHPLISNMPSCQNQIENLFKSLLLVCYYIFMSFNTPSLAIRLFCPNCHDDVLDLRNQTPNSGLVCVGCGLGDNFVESKFECANFAKDEDGDSSMVDSVMDDVEDLSTSTVYSDEDSFHSQSTISITLSARSQSKLLVAFREINVLGDCLSLSKDVIDIAKQVYKFADEDNVFKPGECMTAVAACCIFVACRESRAPRLLGEIHAATKRPKKNIGHCFSRLINYCDAILDSESESTDDSSDSQTTAPGPEDVLAHIANHFQLPVEIRDSSKRIIESCRQYGIMGGWNLVTVVAAAIYFASHLCGIGSTVNEVSTALELPERAIEEALVQMHEEWAVLVPN